MIILFHNQKPEGVMKLVIRLAPVMFRQIIIAFQCFDVYGFHWSIGWLEFKTFQVSSKVVSVFISDFSFSVPVNLFNFYDINRVVLSTQKSIAFDLTQFDFVCHFYSKVPETFLVTV